MDHPRTDPVDHERTKGRQAREPLLHGPHVPGIFGVAVGLVALLLGLFALASGDDTTGTVAIAVAAGSAAFGVGWLVTVHRRAHGAEDDSAATHPDPPAPPPTS